MRVDSRLKRADEGITQGMTHRLDKVIRDTEDIRRRTLESALVDMPLDFEEHERPWVVERIKNSFRVHFSDVHYNIVDGCPLVSYNLGRDKAFTFKEPAYYLQGQVGTDDIPAPSNVDPTKQQVVGTDSVSEPSVHVLSAQKAPDPEKPRRQSVATTPTLPSQSNPGHERPKRQLRRSEVSDVRQHKKARIPSQGAAAKSSSENREVNRPVHRYIVQCRYAESWIFSYVTNGIQEHFILRCPVSSCRDRSFSRNPIESGCGITHLRNHGIKIADEDDLVQNYARRIILRDESETALSFVERHNKDVRRLCDIADIADGGDTDSKSDVDEDIDELGQDTSPLPQILNSVRSDFEKSGASEVSLVRCGDSDS
ncbi:hypothetical protein GCG54_00003145 [Colletotrichum gloeosporioides]|uniref:Uncharacterized protein n=1 Tax=Colletotrichum gloeosporioides TaxID=474922 RepID=A0A8H4CVW3_COLGL|nr:uncharacterized protein GCG54_00003145 [Colletotrichum gloeosporioides]KAF3810967.1 hypothetical protein GCG54_00003145 [Colletotrichum gloeosporioides]